MKRIHEFGEFITAREDVRLVRALGIPPPWTNDPILATYRFCNINREHDTVTQGIRRLYRDKPAASLWFHLIVARLFNHIPTLTNFGTLTPSTWASTISDAVAVMEDHNERVFNPAYIVSTNGKQMAKVPYLITYVLGPIAKDWKLNERVTMCTCQAWADYLITFNGLGDFMVNQIVTDMKYTVLLPQVKTKDWTSFVMAGPGTKRGLNRLFGRPTQTSLSRQKAYTELLQVRERLVRHPLIDYFDDLNNLANSFCEFDKWCRVASGEGRPKQKYRPSVAP